MKVTQIALTRLAISEGHVGEDGMSEIAKIRVRLDLADVE